MSNNFLRCIRWLFLYYLMKVFESKGTKINYGSSKKIMNDDAQAERE